MDIANLKQEALEKARELLSVEKYGRVPREQLAAVIAAALLEARADGFLEGYGPGGEKDHDNPTVAMRRAAQEVREGR